MVKTAEIRHFFGKFKLKIKRFITNSAKVKTTRICDY